MIGVMEKTLSDTLHARFKRDRFYAGFRIFKTLLSTPETITPVLHYSNNPGSRGLAFGPLSGGSKQSHILWA
jgi:hypothetical protein